MKKIVLFLSLFIISVPCFSKEDDMVRGMVYDDKNGNGLKDSNERGIGGIGVSNGDTVVITDRKGQYAIPLRANESLFPILPAHYTIDRRLVNTAFYYSKTSPQSRIDFALMKKTVKKQFRLNAIGDMQVGNYQELDYANRTLMPELLQTNPATVNIFLGDLVNDNLSLFKDIRTLFELLPSQTWTVLGNHDRDADTQRSKQTVSYNTCFGSDVYAFNEGNFHFIVLNNVYGVGKNGYVGRISERQMSFLRNDLRHVGSDKRVVLCMHIPFVQTQNRNDVMKLLSGRGEVLVLSGHVHQVMRNFVEGDGVRIHELGVGASCGFWWVGEKDWEGIPGAMMPCGTPRNYFILDFEGQDYSFRCKAIGEDSSRQMSIWVVGIDTLDAHITGLDNLKAGQVIATIYGSCDETKVRYRIDGGEWQPCQKYLGIDPNVARIRAFNAWKVYPTKHNRTNPLRNKESNQLWTLTLPADKREGAHRIEIQASDAWGFNASGQRSFCFPQS